MCILHDIPIPSREDAKPEDAALRGISSSCVGTDVCVLHKNAIKIRRIARNEGDLS